MEVGQKVTMSEIEYIPVDMIQLLIFCFFVGEGKDNEEPLWCKNLVCHCGRHTKDRSQGSCEAKASGNAARCPCVRHGRQCSKNCKCINCKNKQADSDDAPKGCRCGEATKNSKTEKPACTDVPGQRRTKCPCYASGTSCSAEICKCIGCQNSFGKREEVTKEGKGKRQPKCTSSPSPLKRKRGEDFMKESYLRVNSGSWTTTEACILDAVESFLHATCLLPNTENVTCLYNYVVCSPISRELKMQAGEKSKEQVQGKLVFEKKQLGATTQLAYGVKTIDMLNSII